MSAIPASEQPPEVAPQPSRGQRFWIGLRSWIFTFLIAIGVFLTATTFVGGPVENGAAVTFEVVDLQGEMIRSEALRGKTVVVYVWATWCTACKMTTPTVDRFAASHPDVVVLGVAADEPEAVRAAVAADPRAFRVVPDGTALAQQLGVRAFPTTLVLGPDGRVTWNRQGVLLPGELELRTR